MWLMMILATLPLAACGSVAMGSDNGDRAAASGTGTTRTFAVAEFTAVKLAGADDVDVRVGPAFSVRAEGPSAELDKLDIHKEGSTLWVGREREELNWNRNEKGVKVYVTMPRIAGASLAGSGDMRVDRVSGGNFSGSLAGSGDLSLDELAAATVKLDLAGSGGIAAKGKVQKLSVSIAGSGDVDAGGLTATAADIAVAGSGSVTAVVNGPADVSIMGSGDVSLGAGAKCSTSKMGSGKVHCG